MFINMGEEGRELLAIFFLLVPASFYILGLLQGKAGRILFLMGMIFHIVSMVDRGFVIGGLPLAEKHDNISFMAFSLAAAYWFASRKREMDRAGIIALPLISVLLVVALAHAPINTVSPFLRSLWFYLHMFFFFTSYGFFGVSFCMGIIYVVTRGSDFEMLQYRGLTIGWILYSMSLFLGSIWFYFAYGTYWLWTSREMWTTLTWFYIGLYLHARYIQTMRGVPAAILGIAGFPVALFAYFGMGTVIPSPPVQF